MNVFSISYHRCLLCAGVLLGGFIVLGGAGTAQAQDFGEDEETLGKGARVSPDMRTAAPSVRRDVERAFHGPDGRGKDGPMAGVGRDLILLYQQHQARGPKSVNRLMGRAGKGTKDDRASRTQTHSPVSADGRFVTVDAVAAGSPSTLLADLNALGLKGGATAGNLVSGQLPIAQIEAASQLPSLRGMQASYAHSRGRRAGTAADSVVISEADTSHAAVSGRKALGVDGSGEKICALSDSYDKGTNPTDADGKPQDADADIAEGELPGTGNPDGNVDVLDDSESGSDEGRAMLQLIHDIAPGAKLGFHTAFGGVADFAEGIRELADAGCTVIVDDVVFDIEPFYQDGPVSNAVNDVVNNDDVAYFSAAGNAGDNSYDAPFRKSGENGVINSDSERHDFDSSDATDTEQQITIEEGGSFRIKFQWTDPSAAVSGSKGPDTDLDIALVDQSGTVVASEQTDNISLGIPAGTLEHTNETGSPATYHLIIEKASGPDPDQIKYIHLGEEYTIEEYDTTGPTIWGHAMAEGAEAVAAVPFVYTSAYGSSTDLPYLQNFSSRGGIQIRFDQDGNKLSSPEERPKPDLTGTDVSDNTFFGRDIEFRDADPHPNFPGTSAAAPNVAAVAALVREANPGYTATEVYDHLESSAKDVTRRLDGGGLGSTESIGAGEDRWSGHGFVQATGSVLPVELAEFDAAVEQNRAVLRWTTGSETNNSGFSVEHKRGDGSFEELQFVESQARGGTTTDALSYRYRTSELQVGTHTFRLRQVDLDGSESVSRTVSVDLSLSGSHRVSAVTPNPVRRQGSVSITVREAQHVRAAVYNVLGQQVAVLYDRRVPASDPVTLNLGRNLQSGMYVLRVKGESFSTMRKFVRLQ